MRQIKLWENKLNDENIKEFQRKFGPKINFIHRLKDANNYNIFPNIEKLVAVDSGVKLILPQLKLKQLRKLKIEIGLKEEHMIKKFVDTFPTLTHLNLLIWGDNSDSINGSLDLISNLKHLIHFCFYNALSELNAKLFCDSLKRMANKCQKLKSIEFSLMITSDNSLIQLFSTFVAFPALERLNLKFSTPHKMNFYIKKFYECEAFERLSKK